MTRKMGNSKITSFFLFQNIKKDGVT